MTQQPSQPQPRADLGSLWRVTLTEDYQRPLAAAKERCGGRRAWQHRKLAEATDLARLAQLSNRIVFLGLDLAVALRVELLLRVTVPCLTRPEGPLHVADTARLGVIYHEAAMLVPQPGYSFVQILAPRNVWHPNVDPEHQLLCLGPTLPAGIALCEVVLLCYMALTMVAIQMDPADAAGVLNPAASEWWQRSSGLLPLSEEPFLRPAEEPR